MSPIRINALLQASPKALCGLQPVTEESSDRGKQITKEKKAAREWQHESYQHEPYEIILPNMQIN
jgi:hypothetical protein